MILATAFFAAVVVTDDDRLLGAADPRALILPVIEGALAVTASVWLVGWFQRRWTQEGRLLRALGRGSYGAYVIHPLVIVALAAALRSIDASAELKFAFVGAGGIAASFAVGWALTRTPATLRRLRARPGSSSRMSRSAADPGSTSRGDPRPV